MVQIFSEFYELGVHDAMNSKLLSLQSPNPNMGIHVGDQRSSRISIQRSMGFQIFPQTLTTHHMSPSMDDLYPFQDSSFLPQSTSGFRVLGFHDLRRQGFFPFGFPGAEMSKCDPVATCPSDGWLQPLPMINHYDIFRMINGHYQILAFSRLFTLKPIQGFVYQDFMTCDP
jgi:hypothetical protein